MYNILNHVYTKVGHQILNNVLNEVWYNYSVKINDEIRNEIRTKVMIKVFNSAQKFGIQTIESIKKYNNFFERTF
jgi:uncharacterized Fe-S radical SAM superfamily protein PflX